MISLDGTNFQSKKSSIPIESVRLIWSYVLEKITRQGGPFAGHTKTDQFEQLVDKAIRLFPDGIPCRRSKRKVTDGVSPSEYGQFLKKVFVRTIPTPISDLDWMGF